MILSNLNWWAIIVATVSTMVIGSIWYTPKVFGNTWIRLARIDTTKKTGMAKPIIITVIVSFITSAVMAIMVKLAHTGFGGSYLALALIIAALLWAGFTAARFITHDAFEGRPFKLTLINILHEFVTLIVIAIIIGVWPPA